MAKNKKGKGKPQQRTRQQHPLQGGRRKGGLVDNPVALHVYGGNTAYVPGDRTPAHGTMAYEVRNTLFQRREFGGGGRDGRLRYQPIVFVSAGLMDPLKDFEVKPGQITHKAAQLPKKRAISPQLSHRPEEVAPAFAPKSPKPPPAAERPSYSARDHSRSQSPLFVIDTTGDKSIQAREQPSNESDYSEEEVILFKGRDQTRQNASRSGPASTTARQGRQKDPLDLPELTIELEQIGEKTTVESGAIATSTIETTTVSRVFARAEPAQPEPMQDPGRESEPEHEMTLLPASRSGSRVQQPKTPLILSHSDEEAAIIADYIANMREDSEEDEDEEANDTGDAHPGLGSHAFHMLRDLGGSDSDALPAQEPAGEDPSNSSDDDDDNDDDDEDEDEDEETLARQYAEAQDAKLARLLAKQEEMGLGGDDIMLFDGAGMLEEDDGEGWQIATKQTPRRRKKKGASKQAKIIQEKGQYPSASKMAEAFDDLDLMDWNRPSLNNSKHLGKRQGLDFDVSDSELEEAMQMAWKKDRVKKAEKKKAREELRAQGLLGKNVNPDDLRIKYRGGMSIDDMEVEFETFLRSTQEQMILPPFDKKARQTVHLIANKFRIKSQSAGKGNGRYPVLYRSKATLPFDRDHFNNVFSRIKQSWFPRVDVGDDIVSAAKIFRARSDVGAQRAALKKGQVALREGEVVGQHASELGVENKGRAMLEKMGWSKGMALGTEDNKGITVPVTHVVKKGKAGLGEL